MIMYYGSPRRPLCKFPLKIANARPAFLPSHSLYCAKSCYSSKFLLPSLKWSFSIVVTSKSSQKIRTTPVGLKVALVVKYVMLWALLFAGTLYQTTLRFQPWQYDTRITTYFVLCTAFNLTIIKRQLVDDEIDDPCDHLKTIKMIILVIIKIIR